MPRHKISLLLAGGRDSKMVKYMDVFNFKLKVSHFYTFLVMIVIMFLKHTVKWNNFSLVKSLWTPITLSCFAGACVAMTTQPPHSSSPAQRPARPATIRLKRHSWRAGGRGGSWVGTAGDPATPGHNYRERTAGGTRVENEYWKRKDKANYFSLIVLFLFLPSWYTA